MTKVARVQAALAILIAAGPGHSQTGSWEAASAALNGAIDVHVHASPDSGPRAIDAFPAIWARS